ncbi:hypothetical protein [Streptomyces sp. NPDC001833]|uniref:hypothetical protein n=1 Tax=Streptomyces sp. NPDC001833 TaxID=3154658 RepID=UPI0033253C90
MVLLPRITRGRTALVSAVTAAMLLAGCGSQKAPATLQKQGRSSDITPAQAQQAAQAYEKGNNRINAAMDAAGISQLETQPLSTSSQAWMKISKVLAQKVPPISSANDTFAIPAQTGYPRWFLDISQRSRGGVPYPQPTYSVYVQDSASTPFRVAYALTPTDQETLPAFQRDTKGSALAVTSDAGLAVRFDDLGRDITDHYLKHLFGKDAFTTSDALDGQLATGYDLGQVALKKRGILLARTLTQSPRPTYALRTSDGGALVFNAVQVTDTLTSADGHTMASLRAGSYEAALLGQPKGARAKKFTIRRLEMFMTYVPLQSSGRKAKVMTYSEAVLSVKETSEFTKKH